MPTHTFFSTVSGQQINTRLEKIYPEQFNLDDIAHALSLINRFNGHTLHAYNLAQHSVNCYWVAKYYYRITNPHFLFSALMSKAHKAYIGDTPEPWRKFRDEKTHYSLKLFIQKQLRELFGYRELITVEALRYPDLQGSLIFVKCMADALLREIRARLTYTETKMLLAGEPFPCICNGRILESFPLVDEGIIIVEGLTEEISWQKSKETFLEEARFLFDALHKDAENNSPIKPEPK